MFFLYREIDVAGQRLRNYAYGSSRVVGIRRHVKARNFSTARGYGNERSHHANERRLSGAIGAEESENLALLHVEGNIVNRSEVAILLNDVRHLNRIRHIGRGNLRAHFWDTAHGRLP
jgi:hypothetical protein